jgi:hypothetical protein
VEREGDESERSRLPDALYALLVQKVGRGGLTVKRRPELSLGVTRRMACSARNQGPRGQAGPRRTRRSCSRGSRVRNAARAAAARSPLPPSAPARGTPFQR